MNYKTLSIAIFSLSILTGCASGNQTPPPKTPAELEQMAQSYQYNGSFEASSEVYRQLIDMNPTNFSSVLYQHQIMQNAQTQNDVSLLIEETLKTLIRLEKAQNEHFDGATPQAIAQEKESLGQFIYDITYTYAKINNTKPTELYVWSAIFFYNIYQFYFSDISISKNTVIQDTPENIDDNPQPEQEEKIEDVLDDTFVYANRMVRNANYNYLKRLSDYYERIFELYDRGIIPAESITPLSLIQNDMLAFKTDYINAAIDYALVFKRYDPNLKDDAPGYKFKEIIKLAVRDTYYLNRHKNCYIPYRRTEDSNSQSSPLSECNQKVLNSLERILKYLDTFDIELASALYTIADIYYFEFRQYEKAVDLYWKVIKIYQDSSDDSKDIREYDYDTFNDAAIGILHSYKYLKQIELASALYTIADIYNLKFRQYEKAIDLYWKVIKIYQDSSDDSKDIREYDYDTFNDAARGILHSYKYLKQYDELKTAIQKIKQFSSPFVSENLRRKLDEYEEIFRLCETPEELKRWETAEACYMQLYDIY